MNWKLGIYDWNGTLLNDRAIVLRSVQVIFRSFGLAPPPAETYFGEVTVDYMSFYHRHGIPREPGIKERLNGMRRAIFKKHWYSVQLNAGAMNALAECHICGMRTAVVSAEIGDVLSERIDQFFLKGLVDRVVGDAEDKERELLRVAQSFGVDPSEAFYIDDMPDGILAAKRAGLTAMAFTGGYGYTEQLAAAQPEERYRVDSMDSLIRLLQGKNAATAA